MNPIFIAVIVVCCISIICAIVLSVASKFMAVKEDDRIPKIRDLLPGANCGACGYAGCDAYAKALVEEGAKPNLCIPGGGEVVKNISEALGVAYEDVVKQVAVIHCCGDRDSNINKMDYQGINTSKAVKLLYGGPGMCTFGCLGLGDCVDACPNQAISIRNGIAHVNPYWCTGCSICVKTCPNHLISLMPEASNVFISCSNKEKGAVVRKKCTNGCIACRKCEKECPEQAITIENNLSRIDYDKCTACGHCVEVCPTNCIRLLYPGSKPID